jgi:hypothetical protein
MSDEPEMESGRQNNSKKLDWPTLVLILITGGGNFIMGQKGRNELGYEQQEAISKIRDLHDYLNESQTRQLRMLENQQKILENDTALLKELHSTAERLEMMHKTD